MTYNQSLMAIRRRCPLSATANGGANALWRSAGPAQRYVLHAIIHVCRVARVVGIRSMRRRPCGAAKSTILTMRLMICVHIMVRPLPGNWRSVQEKVFRRLMVEKFCLFIVAFCSSCQHGPVSSERSLQKRAGSSGVLRAATR